MNSASPQTHIVKLPRTRPCVYHSACKDEYNFAQQPLKGHVVSTDQTANDCRLGWQTLRVYTTAQSKAVAWCTPQGRVLFPSEQSVAGFSFWHLPASLRSTGWLCLQAPARFPNRASSVRTPLAFRVILAGWKSSQQISASLTLTDLASESLFHEMWFPRLQGADTASR